MVGKKTRVKKTTRKPVISPKRNSDDILKSLKLAATVVGAATTGSLVGAAGYSVYRKKVESNQRKREFNDRISNQQKESDIKIADTEGYMRGYASGIAKARDDADTKYSELIIRILKMTNK